MHKKSHEILFQAPVFKLVDDDQRFENFGMMQKDLYIHKS